MSDTGQILAAITGLGERFSGLEQRMDRLEQRIGRLEQRVDGVELQITQLRGDVMARLDRQQDLLTSVQNDIGVNMAALDRSRNASRGMQDEVHALSSQVSLVHRRLIALESRVDRQGGHP